MSRQTPEETKGYWERNGDRIREKLREYNRKPETKEIRRQYRLRNPDMQLLINARSRAKRFNLPIDIERSDIVIPTHCPILGIPLIISKGKASNNSPSLDRVDPDRGYVKDNVCVISHKANTMKQGNTVEDFERFIKYIKGELLF